MERLAFGTRLLSDLTSLIITRSFPFDFHKILRPARMEPEFATLANRVKALERTAGTSPTLYGARWNR